MSEELNKVYGIDLGTTYSAISVVNEDGKPEIIPNTEGDLITASAVYFESADNVVVGETAKEQGKIDDSRVVTLIKREMGTSWKGVYEGKEYSPQAISALILEHLVKGAALAGHQVKDVVITCPAYFDGPKREATRLAGEMARLNVLAVVDEPIAAALNYGIAVDSEEPINVVVYDLGGGTFDVTVVRIAKGTVEVVCTDGNHKLGGADWDAALESLMAEKFKEACPGAGDPRDDSEDAYELKMQAEKVKRKLSTAKETSVAVSHKGERAKIIINRAEFEEATRMLLEETIDFTDSMLNFAREKAGVQKIDEFLLVGGSTYMPQVADIIKARYQESLGVEPKMCEPNYAVSKGAAVFGRSKVLIKRLEEIKKELEDGEQPIPGKDIDDIAKGRLEKEIGMTLEGAKGIIITKTVASKSYGIRVLNKAGERVCYNLIKKQTPVPCSASQKFPVSVANAATLPLVVYSNDCTESSEELDLCQVTGDATMELTPGLPQGAPIEVIFSLSEEGQLLLTARDVTNNKEINASFAAKDSLTQEQIEQQTAQVTSTTISD